MKWYYKLYFQSQQIFKISLSGMILYSMTKSIIFKQIGTLIYLNSHLNKTYGSINKPVNHFGKQSKIFDQKSDDTDNKDSSDQSNKQRIINNITTENDVDQDDYSKNLQKGFKEKKNKEVAFFFSLNKEAKLNTIEEYRQKELIKELSMIAREMSFHREKSQEIWAAIESALISFLVPPYDQEKIRSISKFLTALVKSKKTTRKYETLMVELLPHSSVQSFTQIVVSISRLGPMTEQFASQVQKIYWKRREQFFGLEVNLVNYALAKNGKKIDTTLIDNVQSYPLRGIALMLKAYDKSSLITLEILKKCVQPILAKKAETSFFDLKHLVNIYFKYKFFQSYHLLNYFDQQYSLLSSSINQETLEGIWQYLPEAANSGRLPPNFVEQVIRSLRNLKSKRRISEMGWKRIASTFSQFQNPDVKKDLERLQQR